MILTLLQHKVSEPGSVISSSIQVSQTLAIGDVCEYSAYGSSYDCIGSTTSGVCTVTTKTTSSLGAGKNITIYIYIYIYILFYYSLLP